MPARRLAIFTATFCLFAIGAYSLYWYHAAEQVRSRVEAWAQSRRAEGWTATWSTATVSGFPFRLDLHLATPALTTPSGLSWHGDHVRLSAHPWRLDRAQLSISGKQAVWWNGRDLGADVTLLSVEATAHGIDAHAHGLRHASGLSVTDLALSVAALPTSPSPASHPATWRFALSARDLTVPAFATPGFDDHVVLAEISGRVMGDIPPAPPRTALAQWSKQGGVLELDHVAVDWPPLGLEGDGTAALDPHGQPLVALSTRIRGFDALMDRLARNGMVEPTSGRALKTILGLMSKPDTRGRPAIAVPISVQDGQLYLGPARLAPVPAIPWADFTPP